MHQLKRSSKPVVGVLPHRCPACNCDWGYIDGDIPTTLGELLSDYTPVPRNPTIICGQCGRNIDAPPITHVHPTPVTKPSRQPSRNKGSKQR